jgi:hypothetical protein
VHRKGRRLCRKMTYLFNPYFCVNKLEKVRIIFDFPSYEGKSNIWRDTKHLAPAVRCEQQNCFFVHVSHSSDVQMLCNAYTQPESSLHVDSIGFI